MNKVTKSGYPILENTHSRRRRPEQMPSSPQKHDTRQITKHPPQASKPELEKVCSEFASIFSYMLIKNMRSSIPTSSLLKEYQGKKLVNSMVDQKMAHYLSSQNGFGLKELLLRALTTNKIALKNKSEVKMPPTRKE